MGEEKAKSKGTLLVRLQWPLDNTMVVQLSPHREFLERCWKLMLICEKIKRTMGGAGQVIVESHGRIYVSIRSETAVQRLVSMARVKDWESFKCLWVSEDFYIGDCRVMAGVRRNTTHIEEDGHWFEGSDGDQNGVGALSASLGED